jgi:predicted RNA-binding protein associated with RNAse of E/G family
VNRDEDLALYRALADAAGRGERCVLATVVSTRGSTPRKAGTKMLVGGDGRGVAGTVGGGCGEGEVLDAAREVLSSGLPRTVRIDLTEDLLSWSPAVCGGIMEVWLEAVDPPAPEGWVNIHYLRPPDRLTVFTQRVLHEGPDGIVTLARGVDLPAPLVANGHPILEPGADAVWFTFPGVYHDIGRFHRADGTFTGWYANLLTPPIVEPGGIWRTTDLFLDLWMTPDGEISRRDEEELAEAETRGWVSVAEAEAARMEAERIETLARSGNWPPPIARNWTRERALAVAAATAPAPDQSSRT